MAPSLETFDNFQNMFTFTQKQTNGYTRESTYSLVNRAAWIAQEELQEGEEESSSDFDLLWESLEQEEDKVTDFNELLKPLHHQKRVTFSEAVQQYSYIALTDYSEKEIRKCWYTNEDEKKRSEKIQKIVSRMEKGKPARDKGTYRGLQGRPKEGRNRLDKTVMRVVDAVMDEQDQQWAQNYDNVYRIAALSRIASAECRSMARLTAMTDEEESRESWNKVWTSSRNGLSPLSVATNEGSKTPKQASPVKKTKRKGKKSKRTLPAKVLEL